MNEMMQELRKRMVAEQIAGRGIRDNRVLEAMTNLPRHLFVPLEMQHFAYEDAPQPIGDGQTISQPYIVALMTELLQLNGDEKVLEIGTGSGYQASILGYLAKTVHTVERHKSLAQHAEQVLEAIGLDNVHIHVGDGSKGWQLDAPYDAIIVTAAAPEVPPPLFDQLSDGGRLVIPVGPRQGQQLILWMRKGKELMEMKNIPVSFVPLRGEYGWKNLEW